jgi:hypothetical protein
MSRAWALRWSAYRASLSRFGRVGAAFFDRFMQLSLQRNVLAELKRELGASLKALAIAGCRRHLLQKSSRGHHRSPCES